MSQSKKEREKAEKMREQAALAELAQVADKIKAQERAESEKRERERKAQEKKEREEMEKREAERRETERKEREKRELEEKERKEKEKREQEQREAEEREKRRLEKEERERKEAELREKQRLERMEQERQEKIRKDKERQAREEAERIEAERRERERKEKEDREREDRETKEKEKQKRKLIKYYANQAAQCVQKEICTFSETSHNLAFQFTFVCLTCNKIDICEVCEKFGCHKDHEIYVRAADMSEDKRHLKRESWCSCSQNGYECKRTQAIVALYNSQAQSLGIESPRTPSKSTISTSKMATSDETSPRQEPSSPISDKEKVDKGASFQRPSNSADKTGTRSGSYFLTNRDERTAKTSASNSDFKDKKNMGDTDIKLGSRKSKDEKVDKVEKTEQGKEKEVEKESEDEKEDEENQKLMRLGEDVKSEKQGGPVKSRRPLAIVKDGTEQK